LALVLIRFGRSSPTYTLTTRHAPQLLLWLLLPAQIQFFMAGASRSVHRWPKGKPRARRQGTLSSRKCLDAIHLQCWINLSSGRPSLWYPWYWSIHELLEACCLTQTRLILLSTHP